MAARKAIKAAHIGQSTFYKWVDEDTDREERYVRAMQARADKIFEDMLEIADNSANKKESKEQIARNRLQVDTRKWHLSKLAPKKYGDKLDITSDNEKIESTVILLPQNSRELTDTTGEEFEDLM